MEFALRPPFITVWEIQLPCLDKHFDDWQVFLAPFAEWPFEQHVRDVSGAGCGEALPPADEAR